MSDEILIEVGGIYRGRWRDVVSERKVTALQERGLPRGWLRYETVGGLKHKYNGTCSLRLFRRWMTERIT